jgi:hypothetical protein
MRQKTVKLSFQPCKSLSEVRDQATRLKKRTWSVSGRSSVQSGDGMTPRSGDNNGGMCAGHHSGEQRRSMKRTSAEKVSRHVFRAIVIVHNRPGLCGIPGWLGSKLSEIALVIVLD